MENAEGDYISRSLIKSKKRVADHGEVFTPPWLVEAMLDLTGESDRVESRFLEPACGDGNFLIRVLQRKLAVVELKSRKPMGVFRLQATMSDGPGLELVKTQLNELGTRQAQLKAKKDETEGRLAGLEEKCCLPDSTRNKILAFPTLWAKGTPAEQKRLLRTIFKQLLPTEKSLQIFFWLNELAQIQGTTENAVLDPKKEKKDSDSNSASLGSVVPFPYVLRTAKIPAISLNGVPTDSTTSKRKPHCFLELSVLEKPRLAEKIVELFKLGHSIHEIAKTLRRSRGRVRFHLEQAGLLPVTPAKESQPAPIALRGKVRWNSPYGFKYERGRGVRHPQEFETLLLIFQMKDAGLNSRQIADKLNEQKLRPRSATRWDRCTVHRIIEWHDKHPNFLQEVQSWESKNLSHSQRS